MLTSWRPLLSKKLETLDVQPLLDYLHSHNKGLPTSPVIDGILNVSLEAIEQHPAGHFSQFIKYFGVDVFSLWKSALIHQRILFYSSPPVEVACYFGIYSCCRNLFATYLSKCSLDSLLRLLYDKACHSVWIRRGSPDAVVFCKFKWLQQAEFAGWLYCMYPVTRSTLFYFPPGTTERIFQNKPHLYDLFILNQQPLFSTHSPQSTRHAWAFTIKLLGLKQMRWTKRDSTRCCWNVAWKLRETSSCLLIPPGQFVFLTVFLFFGWENSRCLLLVVEASPRRESKLHWSITSIVSILCCFKTSPISLIPPSLYSSHGILNCLACMSMTPSFSVNCAAFTTLIFPFPTTMIQKAPFHARNEPTIDAAISNWF